MRAIFLRWGYQQKSIKIAWNDRNYVHILMHWPRICENDWNLWRYDPEWQTFDMSCTWKTNLKVYILETCSRINGCITNKIIKHSFLACDACFAILYVVTLCKHIRHTMQRYLLALSYKLFVWLNAVEIVYSKRNTTVGFLKCIIYSSICVYSLVMRNNIIMK